MLDYTDISSKVEDIKNALNDLDELVYSQYDGIFQGIDDIIFLYWYKRIREFIQSANKCMDTVNRYNDRLSDAFEDKLRDAYMDLKEKVINSKTNKSKDDEIQTTEFLAEARACADCDYE